MRDNIGDLRGKLADLENKNAQLEKELQNLNYQLNDDQRQYEQALNERDAQLRRMKDEVQSLVAELQVNILLSCLNQDNDLFYRPCWTPNKCWMLRLQFTVKCWKVRKVVLAYVKWSNKLLKRTLCNNKRTPTRQEMSAEKSLQRLHSSDRPKATLPSRSVIPTVIFFILQYNNYIFTL